MIDRAVVLNDTCSHAHHLLLVGKSLLARREVHCKDRHQRSSKEETCFVALSQPLQDCD